MNEITKTYSIKCHCSNCDWEGYTVFMYGQPANLNGVPCPHCGCKYLSRTYKISLTPVTPTPLNDKISPCPNEENPWKVYLGNWPSP